MARYAKVLAKSASDRPVCRKTPLDEERRKAAIHSGQTNIIIGIAVATTKISSGNPMRQ